MDFDQYLKEELEKNTELCDEFNALQPEYEIISKLIETRIELGLTQKELAKKCGIRQSNISRLESGKANPTIKFLQKIAKALDADLFIEFRKKVYSTESIVVPQASPATTVTIVGIACPYNATCTTSNAFKANQRHIIKAGV